MPKLAGRVALITGGGRGIGRAVALAFAAEGARVAVTARTEAELAGVVRGITNQGGRAAALPADLADRASLLEVAGRAAAVLGPIDVLVNNAGVGSSANPRPAVDFDDDFWELSLRLNLTAPYLLSKAVLPGMLQRRWGRILNVASIAGKMPVPHAAAYVASKHGLLGLTRTLALEVAAQGVTVNAICPGPVHTVMNDRRLEYDARRLGKTFEQIEASITPLGRRLEPEEIAPLAVYLASDDARGVTGQAYNICGGIHMA